MANNAVYTQLPILVKRPQAVWPGLDRMDSHRNVIAGDGNCLFASLADQLYGAPTRHLEIRAKIIEHMRDMREDYEGIALLDDIQQKRATRRGTHAVRNADGFEGYLTIMSKHGTYGGEPELCAFVCCFDQDVTVHLPRGNKPDTLEYNNRYRDPGATIKPRLHICYDNKPANAHYDSVRKSRPRRIESESGRGKEADVDAAITARAARHRRADMMKSMMLESLTESDRATSPSISSSQYTSSSKRSFEDDGDLQRARKRVDRKSKLHSIPDVRPAKLQPMSGTTKLRSGLATPASTQDGDYVSDRSEKSVEVVKDTIEYRPRRRLVRDSRSNSSRESITQVSRSPPHEVRALPQSSDSTSPEPPVFVKSTRKEKIAPDTFSVPGTRPAQPAVAQAVEGPSKKIDE